MNNVYIIDKRYKPLEIKPAKFISNTSGLYKCLVDNEILYIEKSHYFTTYEKALHRLNEIKFIGKYKANKKSDKGTWYCAYCGVIMYNKEDVTVDHIVPKSRGGETTYDNLRICCRTCNNLKSSKTKDLYLKLLKENNRRKASKPYIYKKKIRFNACNKHKTNIENIARMDSNYISPKHIGRYYNLVDATLNKYDKQKNKKL